MKIFNVKALVFSTLGLWASIPSWADTSVSVYEIQKEVNRKTGDLTVSEVLFTKEQLGKGHGIGAHPADSHRIVRMVLRGIGNDAYIVVPDEKAKPLLDLLNSGKLSSVRLDRRHKIFIFRTLDANIGEFEESEIRLSLSKQDFPDAKDDLTLDQALALVGEKNSHVLKTNIESTVIDEKRLREVIKADTNTIEKAPEVQTHSDSKAPASVVKKKKSTK